MNTTRFLPLRWTVFEGYRLEAGKIVGVGGARTVELLDLFDERDADNGDKRRRAFTRFASIETEEDALNFARRYGLLGLFGHRYPTPVWDGDGHQPRLLGFVNRHGYFESVRAVLEELAAMVAPAQPVTEAELREALHGKRLNQVVPAVEPVSEWLKAAEEMRQALTTPQEHPNEGVLYLMQSAQGHSLQLGLAGIRLSVSRGQSWTLRWHVSSLLDALWLQAAQSLASAANLGSCERCGSVFIVETNHRVRYCTEECRKSAEKARWYRHRKARRLHAEGKPLEEIAAEVNASVDEVKTWIARGEKEGS